MNGTELAQKIINKFGTKELTLLIKRADINVIYERWQPVTFGEFDRKKNLITINLNTPFPLYEVLAHELGHYFAESEVPNLRKEFHEKIAREFATCFTSQIPAP